MCQGCDVRLECLFTALAAPRNPRGIYGGLTSEERKELLDEHGGDAYTAVLVGIIAKENP